MGSCAPSRCQLCQSVNGRLLAKTGCSRDEAAAKRCVFVWCAHAHRAVAVQLRRLPATLATPILLLSTPHTTACTTSTNSFKQQEAEHAAAIAAVELLTAERVLRPADAPTGSHHSRGTTTGATTASPSVSSATSGVSLPGVGSKRCKSNTDTLDDEPAGGLLHSDMMWWSVVRACAK